MNEVQHFIATAINYLVIWFQTRPPSTWYSVAVFVLTVGIVIGITAYNRRKFFKETAEKLGTKITLLNVWVWSALLTASQWAIDFLANNSAIYGAFLPKELLSHATEVSAAAVFTHAVSTALLKWWRAKKAEKLALAPATVQAIQDAASHISATTPDVDASGTNPKPVTPGLWK